MVDSEFSRINTELNVQINEKKIQCIVVEKPFFDPKKQIAVTAIQDV